MTRAALFLCVCAAALAGAAAEPLVIQNANVLTVTKGRFQGSILIRDGKIAEAGERIMVPPGAKVIDAAGQYIMPGIVDPHSHIASDSVNESSIAVSSMVRIEDVLDPTDIALYRALADATFPLLSARGLPDEVLAALRAALE